MDSLRKATDPAYGHTPHLGRRTASTQEDITHDKVKRVKENTPFFIQCEGRKIPINATFASQVPFISCIISLTSGNIMEVSPQNIDMWEQVAAYQGDYTHIPFTQDLAFSYLQFATIYNITPLMVACDAFITKGIEKMEPNLSSPQASSKSDPKEVEALATMHEQLSILEAPNSTAALSRRIEMLISDQFIPFLDFIENLQEGMTEANLTHLPITDKLLATFVDFYPNLTILKLNSWSHITERSLATIKKLTQLQTLHLVGCTTIHNPNQFIASISEMHTITYLKIQEYKHLNDSVGDSLAKMTGLKHLFISGSFTDRFLEKISSLPALEELSIHDVTNEGVDYIAKMVTLQHLTMNYSERLTNACEASLWKLVNLRTLNMRKCSGLTNDFGNLPNKPIHLVSADFTHSGIDRTVSIKFPGVNVTVTPPRDDSPNAYPVSTAPLNPHRIRRTLFD